MGLYYFHLCDGQDILIDQEGREIYDFSLVADSALHEARAIISQEALEGAIRLDQSIQVRDEDGRLVHDLRFRNAVKVSG